jgi:cell shape-determining protein MreC
VNTIIFGVLAIISLFIFFNLGKVKASRKQLDRPNRINRFGNQQPNNIIEGDAEEINESDEEKKL